MPPPWQYWVHLCFYHLQTKLQEGIVFTGVLLFTVGGGEKWVRGCICSWGKGVSTHPLGVSTLPRGEYSPPDTWDTTGYGQQIIMSALNQAPSRPLTTRFSFFYCQYSSLKFSRKCSRLAKSSIRRWYLSHSSHLRKIFKLFWCGLSTTSLLQMMAIHHKMSKQISWIWANPKKELIYF